MSHVSFADLIARRIPLAAPEAAALTLAVARLMDARRAAGERVRLPDDEWILLSSNGNVSIVDVHGSADVDETAALSALLRRLLRLDERVPSSGHATVPGGLLIVLARNLGYIHLPATGPVVFRASLERFAAANPAVLAAVFWRAAAARQVRLLRAGGGADGRDSHGPGDRRQEGLSRADLRRAVRDLEREVFELRRRSSASGARTPHAGATRSTRRHAVAAAAAAALVGVVTVASLAVRGDAPERVTPADVMLTPASAIVPAVHTLAPETAGLAPDRADPPPRPARPRSRTETRRTEPAGPVVIRTAAPAQLRSDAPRPKPRRNPLAVHRGGTRGIPFALPPG